MIVHRAVNTNMHRVLTLVAATAVLTLCQARPDCSDPNCGYCRTGNVCVFCRRGYYVSDQDTCEACAQDSCLSCYFGAAVCDLCYDGYRLTDDGICEACEVDNCLYCRNDAAQCNACMPGFGFEEDTCISCDTENCGSCDDPSHCTGCKNGYGFTADRTCAACNGEDPNCLVCSTAGTCQKCRYRYAPDPSGLCVDIAELHVEDLCSAYRYRSDACRFCINGARVTDDGQCELCTDRNCAVCDDDASVCMACMRGATMVEGICVPCEVEYCEDCFVDVAVCQRCQHYYEYDQQSNTCNAVSIKIIG